MTGSPAPSSSGTGVTIAAAPASRTRQASGSQHIEPPTVFYPQTTQWSCFGADFTVHGLAAFNERLLQASNDTGGVTASSDRRASGDLAAEEDDEEQDKLLSAGFGGDKWKVEIGMLPDDLSPRGHTVLIGCLCREHSQAVFRGWSGLRQPLDLHLLQCARQ